MMGHGRTIFTTIEETFRRLLSSLSREYKNCCQLSRFILRISQTDKKRQDMTQMSYFLFIAFSKRSTNLSSLTLNTKATELQKEISKVLLYSYYNRMESRVKFRLRCVQRWYNYKMFSFTIASSCNYLFIHFNCQSIKYFTHFYMWMIVSCAIWLMQVKLLTSLLAVAMRSTTSLVDVASDNKCWVKKDKLFLFTVHRPPAQCQIRKHDQTTFMSHVLM